MKLISLNIWGGKTYEPLMKFIKESAPTTDIFCFQEIFSSPETAPLSRSTKINILGDIAEALPDFAYYFAPIGEGFDLKGAVNLRISSGQATFIKKKSVPGVEAAGTVFAFGEWRRMQKDESFEESGSLFHYLRLELNGKKYVVCNFHGLSEPGNKLDTPARLEQSRKIRQFLDGERGAKILCGDFNLLPETQSIEIIEDGGMANLISKFKIERTRSRLSPFFGKSDFQRFADYTFVSADVNVLSFAVPDLEVSDHLPMVLEFS